MNKTIYKRFRHKLSNFERDKEYINWMMESSAFEDEIPHHALGSIGKKKFSDYLVIPLSPGYHDKIHHRDGDLSPCFVWSFTQMLSLQKKYYDEVLKGEGEIIVPKTLNLENLEYCIEITKQNIKLLTEAK